MPRALCSARNDRGLAFFQVVLVASTNAACRLSLHRYFAKRGCRNVLVDAFAAGTANV